MYRVDRDGRRLGQLVGNELMLSLPAGNPGTGRAFLGSGFVLLRNVVAFDPLSGRRLGANAASPLLTSGTATAIRGVGGEAPRSMRLIPDLESL